jgi:parallel beta-helix repeat protein
LTGAAVFAIAGFTASAAGAKTLFVSSKKGNNANPCTATAPCKEIQHAVSKAHAGDTIIVEKGIYRQFISIKMRLRIIGVGQPVEDLRGRDNGFNITGKKASGTVISGFVIEHATFEGILAQATSHVTISNNIVKNNDQGVRAKTPTGECAPQGEVPGDCGEGIHLIGVTSSTVTRNTVFANLGGILLSDEAGPTAHNVISRNNVHGNVEDCGITVVAHKPDLGANGKPQPKIGGVYANLIQNNLVVGNGTKGEGGGILLAAGAPGGAVYNNVIKNNTANGNGLAGVTIHSHDFGKTPAGTPLPAADLNGNRIIGNKLSHNGVADKSEAEFGGADFAKGATVGILVGSAKVKLTGIVITGNTISNSHFGIYAKNDANKVNPKKNTFHNVKVKVKQV